MQSIPQRACFGGADGLLLQRCGGSSGRDTPNGKCGFTSGRSSPSVMPAKWSQTSQIVCCMVVRLLAQYLTSVLQCSDLAPVSKQNKHGKGTYKSSLRESVGTQELDESRGGGPGSPYGPLC